MEELLNIVVKFREAIDRAMNEGEFARDFSFNNFPRGCCGDASDILGHYLLTQGIRTKYVCGNYYGEDEGYGQSHAWLLLGDEIIIDITGDQFKFNPIFLKYSIPVYIGSCDAFHALFEVEPRRDVRDITYINELGPFCAPRLSKLYAKIIQYM